MLLLLFLSFWLHVTVGQRALSKSDGPPSFFLQDPSDGLCLAGDKYKRCGLDTLWYVVGNSGSYQIHHRLVDANDLDTCLDKVQCHTDESELKLSSCNHCGTKKWNILVDANLGYVLTEDKNKHCLKRTGGTASMIKCEKGNSSCFLHLVTNDDITAMGSDGARLINAALDNDLLAVKNFVEIDGVDVNARDWDYSTALMVSSALGHIDVVKYLLSKDADVTLLDKDNVNAFVKASRGGHLEVLKVLHRACKEAGVSTSDLATQTAVTGGLALLLAAAERHTAVTLKFPLFSFPNIQVRCWAKPETHD